MTVEEYIKALERENNAMRATIRGRANKECGLSRTNHHGFVLLSRKVQDAKVRMGSHELHKAMLADFETPYPATQLITPFWQRIEYILQQLALEGQYEEGREPKLWELKFFTTRKGRLWCVTAIYDREWTFLPPQDN